MSLTKIYVTPKFYVLIGVDGKPPDDEWPWSLEYNKRMCQRHCANLNLWAKRYGKDKQAPYRVARVAIIEVTP